MRKLLVGMIAAAAVASTTSAYADSCSTLQGGGTFNFCGTFVYGQGGSNSYSLTFGPGNSFNLNGNSPGTFTCYGTNQTEVDYQFGGAENQQWYGKAPKPSGKGSGYGKSTTNNYMYKFTLKPGACAAAVRNPGHTQAAGK